MKTQYTSYDYNIYEYDYANPYSRYGYNIPNSRSTDYYKHMSGLQQSQTLYMACGNYNTGYTKHLAEKAKDPRKGTDLDEIIKKAKADYRASKDMSWARTDSCNIVRYYAAKADYENKRDLSWAKDDSCEEVKWYFLQQMGNKQATEEAKDPKKEDDDLKQNKALADFNLRQDKAIADFLSNRDLTWAKTDLSPGVRYYAAQSDYLHKRDLSWAKTDSSDIVREWAAEADYYSNKDLSWAKDDSHFTIRYYAAKADYDNGKDLSWARKDASKHIRELGERESCYRRLLNAVKTLFRRKQKVLPAKVTKARLDSI